MFKTWKEDKTKWQWNLIRSRGDYQINLFLVATGVDYQQSTNNSLEYVTTVNFLHQGASQNDYKCGCFIDKESIFSKLCDKQVPW